MFKLQTVSVPATGSMVSVTDFFFFAVNLREDPNQPLNPHPELGKYFKGFTGSRYIPNDCLQQRYPEDVDTA